MAPERFDAEEVGPLADVYALACVLHECLTGSQPYPGTSMEKQIAGHLTKPPPRPSTMQAGVSPKFDDVIAQGMAKNPEERFQSAFELADAARDALDARTAPMPPPPKPAVTQVNPMRSAPVRRPPPPRVATPPRPSSAPKPLVDVRTPRADVATDAEESTGSNSYALPACCSPGRSSFLRRYVYFSENLNQPSS